MSDSNQAASSNGGNTKRRPNPFGPGKNNNNNRERQKEEKPPRNAAKENTAKAPAATAVKEEPDPRDNGDNSCVVCFKVVDIYSIGECDHPVCYECSTRMRVLCQQNECPICRANLSKVIFTNEVLSYRQLEIKNRTGLYDKKHRICFSSLQNQEAYNKLLENPCSMCSQGPFANFAALRDHVKKKHEQFYCDICTDNLSVFSFERRSYTRTDLGIHRRKGDPDDTSHRGHPLCEYCDLRYFDRDELFKHLRREHYYCHFCDADGANCYYADYAALRVHYKGEHFLCEEGECAQEQFTAVFRTEIDLRAHISNTHGQGLSRQAAKQNRTLDFEITLAPRTRPGAADAGGSRRTRDTQHEFDIPDLSSAPVMAPQRVIDARDEQQFPSLGGATATTTFSLRPSVSHKSYGTGGIARTQENFPALGGSSGAASAPSTSNFRQTSASAILKKTGGNATVIHVSNRPNTGKKLEVKSGQDFPSLSGKSKKSASLFLDEDFVSMPSSSVDYNIASKHRSLAAGYEAFAADATTKLGLIKRAETALPKKTAEAPPKLGSKNNFPSLGNAPSPAMAAQWVSLGKKAPVESRKSKVAPPPLSTPTPAPVKPAAKPAQANAASKKETKPKSAEKETKTKPAEKPAPAPSTKPQKKPKNYNPFDDDFEEEQYAPPTTVLHAVSAKHRGLVDSYESINKPGTNGAGKLSLVTRPTPEPKATNSKSSAAPKLSSKDNFPSLGGKSAAVNNAGSGINFLDIVKASNYSNGTKTSNNNNNDMGNLNAPPGFGSTQPPPGFKSVTVNSVAKSVNNLTFTTSLGEQYDILPAASTVYYPYVPPNNSSQRNLALFAQFQGLIADQQVVDSFKQVSQMFINGAYKAQPYYEHCQVALGDRFDSIFPELLVLLPDISKQQELYQVHIAHHPRAKLNNAGGAISKNKKNNNNASATLEVCATCRQVLTAIDLPTHLQSHTLANHFPTLSTTKTGSIPSTAWKNAPKASGSPPAVGTVAKRKRSKVGVAPAATAATTSVRATAASLKPQLDKCLVQPAPLTNVQLIFGIAMLVFLLIWTLS